MTEGNSIMYQESLAIVAKTGAYGLAQSRLSDDLFLKWLNIWALGLSGEVGECIEALDEWNWTRLLEEIADVCWYSMTLDFHLQKDYVKQLYLPSRDETQVLQMMIESGDLEDDEDQDDDDIVYKCLDSALRTSLLKAVKYGDKVKKFTRDYPERGKVIDIFEGTNDYLSGYQEVLEQLSGLFEFDKVGGILNEKLGKRYPSGYNAKDSVNRTN